MRSIARPGVKAMRRFPLCIPWLVLALALGRGAQALGQDVKKGGNALEASQDVDREVRLAQVVVDGETLFSVRGVTAYPAERRARDIANRIRALAANQKIGAESLSLEEAPAATLILADGQHILGVSDEDAAIEQFARRPLAELYRARIWKAIEAYRSNRRPEFLWLRTLYALGMTVVLFIAALLSRRIIAALHVACERRYHVYVEGLEGRALNIVKAEQVWLALTGLLNFAWGLGLALVFYAYLNHVLSLFPWTRGLARSLFAVALDPLRTMAFGLVGMIPNFAFLAILALVTRYALKIIRIVFDGLAHGTVHLRAFDPEWAWPSYRLVRLLVIVLTVVVAYPYIPGSGSEAFKGVSLLMGIIFSLGSSSLTGNFIAGYSLTYRRAFRLGDRVKIGDQIGDVEQVRLLVTHLRTTKNEEVIVPNSTILGSEVINYSSMARQRGLILHTTVGIGYETPWRQVEAMLLEAAARTAGLRQAPAPFVLQKALEDFCVTYEINVGCDTPAAMEELYTQLHRNILD